MESTSKTVVLNGMSFRIWEGQTEKGIGFVALVNRLEPADINLKPAFVSELMAASRDMAAGMKDAFERFGITTGVPEGYGDKPASGPASGPPSSTGA